MAEHMIVTCLMVQINIGLVSPTKLTTTCSVLGVMLGFENVISHIDVRIFRTRVSRQLIVSNIAFSVALPKTACRFIQMT